MTATSPNSRFLSPEFQSLPRLMSQHANAFGEKYAFHFVSRGVREKDSIQYQELHSKAKAIANNLSAQRGQTALILTNPGLDFLSAFLGCLYAGVIAVPVPALDTQRLKRALPRLTGIVNDAKPRCILCDAPNLAKLSEKRQQLVQAGAVELTNTKWLCIDDLAQGEQVSDFPAAEAHQLAYLQYTSGSTRAPRGVQVSHGNLVANCQYIAEHLGYQSDSRPAVWMPYHHDFGLVEGMLLPLLLGLESWMMSPLELVKNPLWWLQMMTKYQLTHCSSPNFALQACVDRVSQQDLSSLDLSAWQAGICAAEPVRKQTLDAFISKFSPCGLSPQAQLAGYGMAETTLIVTSRHYRQENQFDYVDAAALQTNQIRYLNSAEPGGKWLANCGRPIGDFRLVIAGDQGQVLDSLNIGEIMIAADGASCSQGYRNQPELNRHTFANKLTSLPGNWLATGDLGYLTPSGELVVTGRCKDIVIIRGQNHYPHDIEFGLSDQFPALRAGYSACFQEDNEQTDVSLVMELNQSLEHPEQQQLADSIRRFISEHHELSVKNLVFVGRGEVPRTTSGKIQRALSRDYYLQKKFKLLGEFTFGQEDTSSWLRHQLAKLTGLSEQHIDNDRAFADYGLDSASTLALTGQLERQLGRDIPETLLYSAPSINALIAQLAPQDVIKSQPKQSAHISVAGMACRLPGADNLDQFRRLVLSGDVAIAEPAADRPQQPSDQAAGYLKNIDGFDAAFFGLSPAEANSMDPQQRWLLENSWHALEHAGIDPLSLRGSNTGVFVGASSQDFARLVLNQEQTQEVYQATGSALSVLAGRLAYQLGLEGPCMTIDTACSSSLVALHQACESLANGHCDLALVVGVNLLLDERFHQALTRANMLSPQHRCATFSEHADGYVRGEGVVCLVLGTGEQNLPAIAQVLATGTNQDGASNGLTAPTGRKQAELLENNLLRAGLSSGQLDMIECHGTGTPLGDPIEVNHISQLLASENRSKACYLTSVKANIGHLEAAAGLAGLLRTLVALEQGQPGPQPAANPISSRLKLTDRLHIATANASWPKRKPRYGAVNAFGFSGSNACALVAVTPIQTVEQSGQHLPLVMLSAASQSALNALISLWQEALPELLEDYKLAAICTASRQQRGHLRWRLALLARNKEELIQGLANAKGLDSQAASSKEQKQCIQDAPRLATLITAYQSGTDLPWQRMDAQLESRVALPQYPFQHQKYWPVFVQGKIPKDPNIRQQRLAEIWQQCLGITDQEQEDDFFFAGGSSLAASQLVNDLSRYLGVKLTLSQLLEMRSLTKLTQWLSRQTICEAHDRQIHTEIAEGQAFPLSDMQQAYWLGRQEHMPAAMAIQVWFELNCSHVQLDRLNLAWHKLQARHPMLRAVMTEQTQQKVTPLTDKPVVQLLDLRELDSAQQEQHLTVLRAKQRKPHDLSKPDWYTWVLVQLDEKRQRLLITFDGWCIDGASYEILLRELVQLYQQPKQCVPELTGSFRAHIDNLAQQQTSPDYQQDLTWWHQQLETLPPAPQLPLAKRPEQVNNPNMIRHSLHLTSQLVTRLEQLARQEGMNLSTLLLSCYALVLSRWSREPDICVNIPRFNRQGNTQDINHILGEFASFTLLPCRRVRNDNFADFARRLQHNLWKNLDHASVSGVQLLRELNRGHGGKNQLMPYVFTTMPELDGSSMYRSLSKLGEVVSMCTQTPQVWIDCQYQRLEQGMEVSWDVLADLFPHGLISTMFDAFNQLLERIGGQEEAWSESASLPLPKQQQLNRQQFNQTQEDIPFISLYQLFANQLARTPAAPALISSQQTLSYRQVQQQANRLAVNLQPLLSPTRPVAICLEKSPDQIIAVLACQQLATCWLPLDPDAPGQRNQLLLADSEACAIISTASLWSQPLSLPLLDIHQQPQQARSIGLTEKPAQPEDTAYLLYTSGSTGKPKGVMITQAGISNRMQGLAKRYPVKSEDRLLNLSALHHDMAVTDIFLTLSTGAALVVPDHNKRKDPSHWLELMKLHKVSVWNSVPAFLQMLLHWTEQGEHRGQVPDSLRWVLLAGDWIPLDLAERIRQQIPNLAITGSGGPTEVSVLDVYYDIGETQPNWRSIPYGKPMCNARYHVLNALYEPCPDGVEGQLWHGGIGLAKGYLNAPELTKQRFVDADWVKELGEERLFHGGDLGRMGGDGQLEFTGRADFQVKVQGQRIELSEIEHFALKLSNVQQALAITQGEKENLRILLFLITQDGIGDGVEFKRQLAGHLPANMLPAQCLVLDSLPLSPNGKPDRRVLLEWATTIETKTCEPQRNNQLEENIASIWRELLQRPKLGLTDNFFDLGGDSMLAVSLSRRLYQLTGQDLPLMAVFENPTITSQAKCYETMHQADNSDPLVQAAMVRAKRRLQKRRSSSSEQKEIEKS